MTRGLALYQSLESNCRLPFVLWVLCFDDHAYQVLSQMALPSMRLIRQAEFEADDAELTATKTNRSKVEYYWTCTPSLPLHILRVDPSVDIVTYLDADIFFYSDPQPLFDELGSGSILITEHRWSSDVALWAEPAGYYNVQFLIFRRDDNGLRCLRWWRDRCIEWCYARGEDGKYGDQKYLDDWPKRFEGVVVTQHKGAGVAPWNMRQYQVRREGQRLMVDDVPLIFYHFHALKLIGDVACQPPSMYYYETKAITAIYMPYLRTLNMVSIRVSNVVGDPGAGRSRIPVLALMRGLLCEGWLLAKWPMIAAVLWRIGGYHPKSEHLLDSGYTAFSSGQYGKARRLLLNAVRHKPVVLARPGVMAIIMKTYFSRDLPKTEAFKD